MNFKKNFYLVAFVFFLLLKSFSAFADSNFTISISGSSAYTYKDVTGLYCKPHKSGSALPSISLVVKNNTTVTRKVAFDKNASFSNPSWLSLNQDEIEIAGGASATFVLTITPAAGASNALYTFMPSFIDRATGYGFNNGVEWISFYVDNTLPSKPNITLNSSTTNSVNVSWSNCNDLESSNYTSKNQSSGISGIESYTAVIKNTVGTLIESKTVSAAAASSYNFSSLIANQSYKITVSATDLAGNSSTSAELTVRTRTNAPTNVKLTQDASIPTNCTLTWTSTACDGYYIYNKGAIVATIAGSATSYTFTNLCLGSTNSIQISSYNTVGESSLSTALAFNPTTTINGPSLVCTTSSPFSIAYLPSNYTVSWSQSSNLTTVSGQNTNSYVVGANGTGYGSVTATINTSCGSVYTISNTFWVGAPATPIIDNKNKTSIGTGSELTLSANSDGALSYIWSTTKNCHIADQGSWGAIIIFDKVGTAIINVYSKNTCGISTTTFKRIIVSDDLPNQRFKIPDNDSLINLVQTGTNITLKDEEVIIYPNPISDVLNITVPEEFIDGGLQIININGKIVKSSKISDLTISLSVQDLLPGVYTVIFNYKGKTEVRKIVKK